MKKTAIFKALFSCFTTSRAATGTKGGRDKSPARKLLRLESLEERQLLSVNPTTPIELQSETLIVDTTSDVVDSSDEFLSLREAIAAETGDVVSFDHPIDETSCISLSNDSSQGVLPVGAKLNTPTITSVVIRPKGVTLAWNALKNADFYNVAYSTDGTTFTVFPTGGRITEASFSVTGFLTPNTHYWFSVRAFSNSSNYTMSERAIVDSYTPSQQLETPTLSIVTKNSSTITVTINAVSGASGYVVQHKLAGQGWSTDQEIRTSAAGSFDYTVVEGNVGAVHEFRVMALGTGAYIDSPWSGSYYGSTQATQLATPSYTITDNVGSLTLKITAVPNASAYRIQHKLSTQSWPNITNDITGTTLTMPVDHANAGKQYNFRVMALSGSGYYIDSAWKEANIVPKAQKTQLAKPGIVSLVDNKDATVTINLGGVAGTNTYKIAYKLASDSSWTTKTFTGTSSTVSTPSVGNEYQFKAASVAENASYTDSDWSGTVSVTPTHKMVTPQLVMSNVYNNGLDLVWHDLAHEEYYRVQYSTDQTNWTLLEIDGSTNLTIGTTNSTLFYKNGDGDVVCKIRGKLNEGVVYYFRVRALAPNSPGYVASEWSNVVSGTANSTMVTTILDVVDPDDGVLSLREAIAQADSGEAITFSPSLAGKTIVLNGSQLVVNKGIAIDATSLKTAGITIDAGEKSTVMTASGGTSNSPVRLKNLTLTGGKTAWYGGLLYTKDVVSVQNCKFNAGFAYYGGAIANEGTLTVENSSFNDNQGSHGGAMFNRSTGMLTLSGITATTNSATNYGGVLYNNGTATITDSEFQTNSSKNRAGAIYVAAGTVSVAGSTFVDNTAANFGGAVYNAGTFDVSTSSITGGSAIYGGAIANFKTLTVASCDLTNNSATKQGGAIYHSSSIAVNLTDGSISGNSAYQGGGLYVRIGTVRLTGTELKSNSVTHNGGAIYSRNQTILTDCVVSGNSAKYYGGGVYNEKILRVRGTTSVADNATETGKSQDIHTKSGGQIIYDSELVESVFDENDDWTIEL